MKLAGAGRILLWNGGSVWIGRTGDAPTEFHAHHAVQVSLALSSDGLRLRSAGGEWASYRAAIVPANAEHAFDGGGHFIANVFAEPESRAGQMLQQQCNGRIHAVADAMLGAEAAALFAAYRDAADDPALVAAARAVVAKLTATLAAPQATLDPRIRRALELIRARIGDDTIALADIANATHLSPDRFRHLFLEQTGIRFRPYVLWLRIEVALAAYAAHSNLTEASHAGGFADAAHFSRSFKSMFGIAPSALQID